MGTESRRRWDEAPLRRMDSLVCVDALRCPYWLCCGARFLQLIGTNEGLPKLRLVHRDSVVGVPDGRCHRRITPPQQSRWLDTLWDGCCVWGWRLCRGVRQLRPDRGV